MSNKYIKPEFKLFDNQIKNVNALIRKRKVILTDHVGSGKTMSIVYAFSILKDREKLNNLVVLTPLSAYAKSVWKKDIVKFTRLRVIDIEVLAKRLEGHFDKLDLILDQYDVIYGKHSHFKQIKDILDLICSRPTTLLCIDECHAFKNPKSALTCECRDVVRKCVNSWFITGTSLSKNIEDVYNLVNLLRPWYLGSFMQFRDDFCNTTEKVIGRRAGRVVKVTQIIGVKNENQLKEKLSNVIITGESFTKVKYHYIDYGLSAEEETLYHKIANGLDLSGEASNEEWISYLLNSNVQVDEHPIKEVGRYSSRFIYLQTAADGVLSDSGNQNRLQGTKVGILIDKVKELTSRDRSVIVYFDFKSSLEVVQSRLKAETNAEILISTGDHVLPEGIVTEAKCKLKPHVILCTRAASESESYYFIGDVIFFHIPTVPHCFVQLLGRITRKNSLFKDDLHCWIFRSNNIDLYKLLVVSAKSYQMELVQGEELNIPPDYKMLMRKAEILQKMKKVLLWQKKSDLFD